MNASALEESTARGAPWKQAMAGTSVVAAGVPGVEWAAGVSCVWIWVSTVLSALTIASNIGITWYQAVHLERRLDQERLLDAQRAEYLGVAVKIALTMDASPQQRRAAQDLATLLVTHQTRDAQNSASRRPAKP